MDDIIYDYLTYLENNKILYLENKSDINKDDLHHYINKAINHYEFLLLKILYYNYENYIELIKLTIKKDFNFYNFKNNLLKELIINIMLYNDYIYSKELDFKEDINLYIKRLFNNNIDLYNVIIQDDKFEKKDLKLYIKHIFFLLLKENLRLKLRDITIQKGQQEDNNELFDFKFFTKKIYLIIKDIKELKFSNIGVDDEL